MAGLVTDHRAAGNGSSQGWVLPHHLRMMVVHHRLMAPRVPAKGFRVVRLVERRRSVVLLWTVQQRRDRLCCVAL